MPVISIVVADDHRGVRESLCAYLEHKPGLQVVGEAADGLAAVALVEQLKPAVLVLDLSMPGLDGTAVTERLRSSVPATRVVIYSMSAEPEDVERTRAAGAWAHVSKAAEPNVLLQAILEAGADVAPDGHRQASPTPRTRELTGSPVCAEPARGR